MLLHKEKFGTAEVDAADIPAPRASAPKQHKPRFERPERHERPDRPDRPDRPGAPASADGKATLFISLGKEAGLRPGDLVGAIANEAGLESKQIGPINIQHRFSLVGVPADRVNDIIRAMRATTIRGRKAMIRLDRDGSS
jgi:ATP-dependent RNA helicase DeaD